MAKFAGYEFLETETKEQKHAANLNGALLCFCNLEKKTLMKDPMTFSKTYKQNYEIIDFDGNSVSKPICKQYIEDSF